eukprot:CAMPEP_0206267926 /NCGR_PEP_ID=MMETSP0047_2-20121206/31423_1 /ASSEMBLY_ACC=CAM_ASM_000192 /TAXON_ID=195065 /ORGANISM="Chroomonas mesostigmatica_cf, Strain CCMP1168" /LENGTH=144 /DNA_ID=CAMNT_0053696189 /DNA_START=40 /DNA_END=471 /DNA_ORIENTATION=-
MAVHLSKRLDANWLHCGFVRARLLAPQPAVPSALCARIVYSDFDVFGRVYPAEEAEDQVVEGDQDSSENSKDRPSPIALLQARSQGARSVLLHSIIHHARALSDILPRVHLLDLLVELVRVHILHVTRDGARQSFGQVTCVRPR